MTPVFALALLLAPGTQTVHIPRHGAMFQMPVVVDLPSGWKVAKTHPKFGLSVSESGIPWFAFKDRAFASISTIHDPSGELTQPTLDLYRRSHIKHPEYSSFSFNGGTYYPCFAGTSGLHRKNSPFAVWGDVDFLKPGIVLTIEFHCRDPEDLASVISFAKAVRLQN